MRSIVRWVGEHPNMTIFYCCGLLAHFLPQPAAGFIGLLGIQAMFNEAFQ